MSKSLFSTIPAALCRATIFLSPVLHLSKYYTPEMYVYSVHYDKFDQLHEFKDFVHVCLSQYGVTSHVIWTSQFLNSNR